MKRILVPLLSLGLAGSLGAQTSSEIRREIADYQQRLNQLQTDQNTLRERIATDKRSIKQLEAECKRTTTEIDNNIANDHLAIQDAEARIALVDQKFAAYSWRMRNTPHDDSVGAGVRDFKKKLGDYIPRSGKICSSAKITSAKLSKNMIR